MVHVRTGKPSTFIGLWTMPKDEQIPKDGYKDCVNLDQWVEDKGGE